MLDFSMTKLMECFDRPTNDAAQRMTLIEVMRDPVAEKYGRPVSEVGSWPTHDALLNHFAYKKEGEQFKSDRIWKSEGQVITESLSVICESVFLSVQYKSESQSSDF